MGTKNSHVKTKDFKHIQLRQKQKEYYSKILENEITLCYGPAGSAKTFVAVYAALALLADADNNITEIICTKPIKESGEKLGFLPGDEQEKISPFIETFRSTFDKIIGKKNREWLETLEVIKYKPLAYMRGATYDNSIMLLDEAQNADMKALMLFITRMGKSSKIIVSGDISQYDIKYSDIGLPVLINILSKVKKVGIHKFNEDDIVRAKILKDIVHEYEKYKYKNEIQ